MTELVGCAKCMKYLLFVINLVIFLCGAALLGVGIWSLVSYSSFSQVLDNALIKSAVYVLIAVGGVVAIIAFLGCCGAYAENKLLLALYAIILLIMFVAEVAAGAYIFYVGSSDVEEFLVREANKTFVKYGENEPLTKSWDTVQHLGKCCGINGPGDFKYTKFEDDDNKSFPDSCCTLVGAKEGEYKNTTRCHNEESGYWNKDGCVPAFKDYVDNNIFIVAGIAIGVAALQLVGIIGGCVLFCAI